MPLRKLLFCAVLIMAGFAASGQYNFFRLTTENGLNSSNVRCILQDYQDFIWIGTEDGLHRYDGSKILHYRYDPADSTTLSSNFVLTLFEDSQKNLWIGTLDGGLMIYDREKDSFRRFDLTVNRSAGVEGKTITTIFEDQYHNLLIGTEKGHIYYFKVPKGRILRPEIKQLPAPTFNKGKRFNNTTSPMAVDTRGTLWMTYNGMGIYKVDIDKNSIYAYSQGLLPAKIVCMEIDSHNRMWVGTWDDGLYVFDLISNTVAHFTANDPDFPILHDFVTQIKEDQDGNVWVGTDDGVNVFENEGSPFHNPVITALKNDDEDSRSLLSNPVKSIHVDKDGRVWIGTYFGGVNIFDKNAPDFITVRKQNKAKSLTHNNVTAILADKQKRIWVGTDGGGVNLTEKGIKGVLAGEFEKNLLKPAKVKAFALDSLNNIWVGTWGGGLYKINSATLATVPIRKSNTAVQIPSNEIISLAADNHNRLWVGTYGSGLFSLNTITNEIKRFQFLQTDSSYAYYDNITALFLDRTQKLWVAREGGGLSYYDSAINNFRSIDIPILSRTVSILTINQDKDGTYWLGTNSNGLIHYDHKAKVAERFNEREGLASSVVHAILFGNDNKLWLSTNKGVSSFDPRQKSFENYSKKQGLQDSQFNTNSSMRDRQGLLLFGGIRGLNVFDPKEIKPYKPVSRLLFTGFWVHNAPYTVNNGGLPRNIILLDSVELDHTQNSLSVEFAAVDHNFAADREYAFLLEGFNTEWQNINRERKVTFTNLPPDHYILHIKSSDNEGRWIESEKALHIYIKPAWWQRWWFKIFAFVLLVSGGVFGVRFRIAYLEQQKKQLEQLVTLRTTELKQKNDELAVMVSEVTKQNNELHTQRLEIAKMNNEIQEQNQELKAQNDHIIQQREELEVAQEKLKYTNDKLERLVEQRTKKLKATIHQLDKTVYELDRFVYSASHDLSAPLKSILGLIALAKIEKDISRLQEYHHYIEESILKLELVIKSLVHYSRNAHLDLDIRQIYPSVLADEVIQELRYLPESVSVRFENNISDDISIDTDPSRLKLVFQNIIGNAIKYSDEQKTHKIITVSGEVMDDKVYIEVRDNGIGIAEESLPKIFSMYYRATEKSKGSGLGLFIVKETVNKLNGNIRVESRLSEGSRFVIELPVRVEVETKPAHEDA